MNNEKALVKLVSVLPDQEQTKSFLTSCHGMVRHGCGKKARSADTLNVVQI